MLICSGGNILFAGPFLIPSGIGIVILALAFLFPRAVAFPLFLACGLLVVFLGYTFLRFPLLASGGTPLALVHQQPDKTLLIRFTYHLGYGDETGDLVIEDGGAPEFSAARIYFDERYPLIGGQNRGALTRVRRTTEDYYVHTFPVAEQNPLGISFQACHTGPGPLPPGKAVLFLVDGKTPSLRWSGRL
jgi:hypothetical protein